jgi:hypothetical protein
MTRQSIASPQGLDPASCRTIKRFLATLALFIVFAAATHQHSFAAAMMIMAAAAGAIEFLLALAARERLLGPVLNRWDVSLAFVGIHALARIFVVADRCNTPAMQCDFFMAFLCRAFEFHMDFIVDLPQLHATWTEQNHAAAPGDPKCSMQR